MGKRRISEIVYFVEGIEDVVEIDEDFVFCDFGNVIYGFVGIVLDLCILVCEVG